MHTLEITIGQTCNTTNRDYPNQPMPESYWQEFQIAIDTCVKMRTTPAFTETHYGRGTWEDKTELSAKLCFFYVEPVDSITLDTLKERIAEIGARFWQDATAFAVGESSVLFSKWPVLSTPNKTIRHIEYTIPA